jgi:hypothetical protein
MKNFIASLLIVSVLSLTAQAGIISQVVNAPFQAVKQIDKSATKGVKRANKRVGKIREARKAKRAARKATK